MSWFNGIVRYTPLTETESFALDSISTYCKNTLPTFGDKYKMKNPANLKGYFAQTSWGTLNSFADLRADNPETNKLRYSNYRFAFPSRINTCYLAILSACQRTLRLAFPELRNKQLAITMAQLTWAMPNDIVPEHVDSEIGYKLSYRIHLPVTGESAVYLRKNNHNLVTKPGFAYALNNRIPHSYKNECGELNTFFTIDFIEIEKLAAFPDAAFWTKDFPKEEDEPAVVDALEVLM